MEYTVSQKRMAGVVGVVVTVLSLFKNIYRDWVYYLYVCPLQGIDRIPRV